MNNGYAMRVIFIPSAVLLSVMFGGSYGSGREIVEFISQHGVVGGFASIATIVAVFIIVQFICYEIARLFKIDDYRGLARKLLGRGWFLYEVLILLAMIIALAVCASAAGAISNNHFGLPVAVGGAGLLFIIVTLSYFGRSIVERSMVISVILLAAALIYLFAKSIDLHGDSIAEGFTNSVSVDIDAVVGGLTYGLTNGGFIPVLLYCARDLNARSEVLVASSCAATFTMFPALLLHLAYTIGMPEIYDKELPAYWLVETVTSPTFLNIYVAIVFVMIALTGVGLLQGFLERIDGWRIERTGQPMSKLGHAITAGSALLASSAMASVGLIALIASGYIFLSLSFLVVFFIPLLTVGIWHIINKNSATGEN